MDDCSGKIYRDHSAAARQLSMYRHLTLPGRDSPASEAPGTGPTVFLPINTLPDGGGSRSGGTHVIVLAVNARQPKPFFPLRHRGTAVIRLSQVSMIHRLLMLSLRRNSFPYQRVTVLRKKTEEFVPRFRVQLHQVRRCIISPI